MSELERLKSILLGSEQARLAALESHQQDLPAQLPALIEQSQQQQPDALAKALATPVAEALGGAVQARRQQLVDALFPVIMPAIRRSITEYLRAVSSDLNRIFESSLTWRGLKWRLEARRLGVSYAAIALRHSLLYQVDHLFLIQRESGLILDRESAPGLAELDADAVAGMLTAIGDFVRDSVGEGQAELSSATVGEHLIWVLSGPKAKLAAWIQGVPPESLKTELAARLERVHADYGDQLGLDPAQLQAIPGLRDALTPADLKATRDVPANNRSMRPVLWLGAGLLLLLLLILGWLWHWDRRLDALEAKLQDMPGVRVLARSSWPGSSVRFTVLRDPVAEPIAPVVRAHLGDAIDLTLDEEAFVSADGPIVAQRLRDTFDLPSTLQILQVADRTEIHGSLPARAALKLHQQGRRVPGVQQLDFRTALVDWSTELGDLGELPEDLHTEFDGTRVRLSAFAPRPWIQAASARLRAASWSRSIDLTGLSDSWPAQIVAVNAELAALPVHFEQARSDRIDGLPALLAGLPDLLQPWAGQTKALRVQCVGGSDPSGAETGNLRLELARATRLCNELRRELDLSMPGLQWEAAASPDRATIRERTAYVRLELIDPS
ncbi:hypothetical protein C7S18_09850 [Ahniella affigens]|uniref:Flagellar motor protein MotB n=1 Tax=Ahniella affigens TaxID=2021234 RepID=A0A2P1PRL2_9GAMM|nr:hypothetical protein [Ahniella affigens]AVP97479.1 hypothetical protein C7S18_09850 [Ahniella affigens]